MHAYIHTHIYVYIYKEHDGVPGEASQSPASCVIRQIYPPRPSAVIFSVA